MKNMLFKACRSMVMTGALCEIPYQFEICWDYFTALALRKTFSQRMFVFIRRRYKVRRKKVLRICVRKKCCSEKPAAI